MRNVDPTPGLPSPEIPDKLYFRIGDVSRLAAVKPFVLRFWESEFPQLAPKKSGTGHRLYRRKDVEMVLEIKRLLYEERFTIEGARNYLQAKSTSSSVKAESKKKRITAGAPATHQTTLFDSSIPKSVIEDIRTELRGILSLLS